MKQLLFWTSNICSVILAAFWGSPASLNGYSTDFYALLLSLTFTIFSSWTLYKQETARRKSFISLSLAVLQAIGLLVFLWAETIHVKWVYEPALTKKNLYSSGTGWYWKAYFKPHNELCGDGELWQTKVPYYFPLIEIETQRNECYIVAPLEQQ